MVKKILFFLGLIIVQLVIIFLLYFVGLFAVLGLIGLCLGPLPQPERLRVEWITTFSVILFCITIVAIPVISVLWVSRDVKRFIAQGVNAWTSNGWALVVLFFWFPGISVYLTRRKFKYTKELQALKAVALATTK